MGATGAFDLSGARVVLATSILACIVILLLPMRGVAQTDEEPNIDQLAEGQQVYSDNCSSCHQPSGLGIPGAIPPLKDNPHVDDAEYVAGVVASGRTGPIEVNGETFDGVMPPFSTLDDDQIEAVIAYLQNDLVVPGGQFEPDDDGPSAGTTLPIGTSTLSTFAYIVAFAIVLWVFAPRIVGVVKRGSVSTIDAGLKSGLIVIYFIAMTVLLPSALLATDVLSRLPEGVQDFVASATWVLGLGIGILGLWWFQRQDRI